MNQAKERYFLFKIIPAIVLLLGLFFLASNAMLQIPGWVGAVMAWGGVVALGLGVLIGRSVWIDSRNYRILKNHFVADSMPEAQQQVALEGKLQPLEEFESIDSPLTDEACVGFRFQIAQPKTTRSSSGGTGSSLLTIAGGLSFRPCKLVNDQRKITLASFPVLQDSLRNQIKAKDCESQLANLFETLLATDMTAIDAHRGKALEYQVSATTAIDDRGRHFDEPPRKSFWKDLVLWEEVLPARQSVCLVGELDPHREWLSASRGFKGQPVYAYRGTRAETLQTLQQELRVFGITTAVLITLGVLGLGLLYALGN